MKISSTFILQSGSERGDDYENCSKIQKDLVNNTNKYIAWGLHFVKSLFQFKFPSAKTILTD